MKRFSLALFLVCFAASAFAQIAEGDQHWLGRAEGHQAGLAQAAPIDAAIAAYRTAVAQNPTDLEARWKLMRAIRFKGSYVLTNQDQKKELFAEGKKLGEESVGVVEKLLAAKGVKNPANASPKQIAPVVKTIPGAGEVYYWDAALWGEWALVYGKFAAVRQGAADRIRRESTIVMLADPAMERGGGARILGRLHNQTPHVPFLTGWASDAEAVKLLQESVKQDPTNKLTNVFLAEAMVANDRSTKPKAVEILRHVIASPNDPEYAVEDASAQQDARKLMNDWGVK
ncbi:MAG: hypothetical protein WBX15_18445 [Thermoanaerobaculia bacterium]